MQTYKFKMKDQNRESVSTFVKKEESPWLTGPHEVGFNDDIGLESSITGRSNSRRSKVLVSVLQSDLLTKDQKFSGLSARHFVRLYNLHGSTTQI